MQQLVKIDLNVLIISLSTCVIFRSFYFIPFQIYIFIVLFLRKDTEGGRTFSMRTIRNCGNELSVDVKKVKNVKSFQKKLF